MNVALLDDNPPVAGSLPSFQEFTGRGEPVDVVNPDALTTYRKAG